MPEPGDSNPDDGVTPSAFWGSLSSALMWVGETIFAEVSETISKRRYIRRRFSGGAFAATDIPVTFLSEGYPRRTISGYPRSQYSRCISADTL